VLDMALYYFDMRDDDQFHPEDQGTELAGGLAAARHRIWE
jgi:hypothetical protein